ncbi:MAG: hypothetical protein MRECE_45c005 [Mycoplasmataceae bacterium CE_OT135]|nr:MAG: hypothetical protein MRECE_45c005 [Mycoplasmataceae bacterium CE_OT135]
MIILFRLKNKFIFFFFIYSPNASFSWTLIFLSLKHHSLFLNSPGISPPFAFFWVLHSWAFAIP